MVLAPSKTTAISDGILALSCIWSLYKLQEGLPVTKPGEFVEKIQQEPSTYNQLAQVWFGLTLVASLVGIFRFSQRQLFERLTPVHETLSWIALVVGLPCLVAQFYYNSNLRMISNIHLLGILPAVLTWIGGQRAAKNRATRILALVSDVSLAAYAVMYSNFYALAAAIMMVVSSWLVGANQSKLGLMPVDWFHYGIVASNYLLVAALGKAGIPGMQSLRGSMPSMFG